MPKSTRSAQLVLNTANFYPAATTNGVSSAGTLDTRYGTADAARINCTYTNIDWLLVLGDLYWQYSSFLLCLESFVYQNAGGTPFASGYQITVNARGLPWIAQCYDAVNKNQSDQCQIYCGGLVTSQLSPSGEGCIFARPNRFTDFTLTMANAMTGGQSVTSVDRSACVNYVFRIYGVDKV
jgi:hypothetical protein